MTKKILCALVLLLALVCALVSCQGEKGDKGDDGLTPTIEISDDGYWIINGEKTDVKAKIEEEKTKKYKVFFETNSESIVPDQEVDFGNKAIEPSAPTKNGYTFDGWYFEDEKWSFIGYSITDDITLTAKWIPINYTISYFNLASKDYPTFNNSETQIYTIEDSVDLYVPTQNGEYSFRGWYLDETLTQPMTEFVKGTYGDINLYAKWENIGIAIENKSNLSTEYNCKFNTADNIFEYNFFFEITDYHYDDIDVTFEFLSEDGVKYSNEELISNDISYSTSYNCFYISIPYDIKGTLKILTVNGTCYCGPFIPLWS